MILPMILFQRLSVGPRAVGYSAGQDNERQVSEYMIALQPVSPQQYQLLNLEWVDTRRHMSQLGERPGPHPLGIRRQEIAGRIIGMLRKLVGSRHHPPKQVPSQITHSQRPGRLYVGNSPAGRQFSGAN